MRRYDSNAALHPLVLLAVDRFRVARRMALDQGGAPEAWEVPHPQWILEAWEQAVEPVPLTRYERAILVEHARQQQNPAFPVEPERCSVILTEEDASALREWLKREIETCGAHHRFLEIVEYRLGQALDRLKACQTAKEKF